MGEKMEVSPQRSNDFNRFTLLVGYESSAIRIIKTQQPTANGNTWLCTRQAAQLATDTTDPSIFDQNATEFDMDLEMIPTPRQSFKVTKLGAN